MQSIRRSCHAVVQRANATQASTYISQRAFSRSTAFHRGALPVYLPASTPELSKLLATANSRVLLPLHLTPEQQKLVYKQENRAKLESEPIEITLGDVTLPLEHLDPNKDIPNRNSHLHTVLLKSETEADFENVLRLMEGYENAGIHMKMHWQAKIVRHLSKGGMRHLILKALQRASATGLRLQEWDVIRVVLKAVREPASTSGWDINELKKALSMAEQVVALMEEKEHLPRDGHPDYRGHPLVIALPLEMAAELAYRHDQDVGLVKKYAQRLMAALKQHDWLKSDIAALHTLATARPADFPRPRLQAEAAVALALAAYDKIGLWNGLSTARTVLDDTMPMAEDAERVQKELRAALEAAEEGLRALGERDGKIFRGGEDRVGVFVSAGIRQCEDEDGAS